MQGLVVIRAAALMSSGERFAIGTFELHGVKDSPAGRPRIEVKFHVDGQRVLHVTAVHVQDTGHRNGMVLTVREVGAFHWPPAQSESYGKSFARSPKNDEEEHFRAPSDALGPVDLETERQLQHHRPTLPPQEPVPMQSPPKVAPVPPMDRGQPMSRREQLLAQRAAQRQA